MMSWSNRTEGWRAPGDRPLEFRTDVPPELRVEEPGARSEAADPRPGSRRMAMVRWGLTIALLLLLPALCAG